MILNKIKQFVVLVILAISVGGLFGCQNTEDSAPVPGVITHFTNVTSNTMVMHWTRASDSETFQPYLEYKVLTSRYNNLDTLDNALSNGTVITYDDPETEEVETISWNRDITSLYLNYSGFTDGQTYYFTVIVRDAAWRQAAYPMASQKTIDITAPVIQGGIQIVNETADKLELDWPAANDNGTNQELLEYQVVKADAKNSISTVTNALSNGTVVQAWTTLDAITVPLEIASSLSSTEYFNVLVRDSATDTANIAIYEPVNREPSPGGLGKVTADDITVSTCTLQWDAATDFNTEQSELQYQIEQKDKDNTLIPVTWTKNLTQFAVTGLQSDTSYSFTVTVKDSDGLEVAYQAVSIRTLENTASAQNQTQSRSSLSLTEDSGRSVASVPDLNSAVGLSSGNPASVRLLTEQGDLLVWLDGSDVQGDGSAFEGPVIQWNDRSGNGNHAVSDSLEQSPFCGPGSLKNRSTVHFEAVEQQVLRVSSVKNLLTDDRSDGYTAFLVVRPDESVFDGGAGQTCFATGSSTTPDDSLSVSIAASGMTVDLQIRNQQVSRIDLPDRPRAYLLSWTVTPAAGGFTVDWQVNGQTRHLSADDHPVSLDTLWIGGAADQTRYFSGELAELLVFDRKLTEDQYMAVDSYLQEKWGAGAAD